jgi:hypothetical protein
MGLRAIESAIFGGVDSRSNPVNMPQNRSIRTRNFAFDRAANLRLRDGYTLLKSTGSGTAIASQIGFTLSGTRYLNFFQGAAPKLLNVATMALSTPTVKGTAFASNARGCYFFANQRLYYFNGTDKKFFDGTYWRDIGLPSLTADQIKNVTFADGVREVTAAEVAAATVGTTAGGSWGNAGVTVYCAYFDTSINELGPATIALGTAKLRWATKSPSPDSLTCLR